MSHISNDTTFHRTVREMEPVADNSQRQQHCNCSLPTDQGKKRNLHSPVTIQSKVIPLLPRTSSIPIFLQSYLSRTIFLLISAVHQLSSVIANCLSCYNINLLFPTIIDIKLFDFKHYGLFEMKIKSSVFLKFDFRLIHIVFVTLFQIHTKLCLLLFFFLRRVQFSHPYRITQHINIWSNTRRKLMETQI